MMSTPKPRPHTAQSAFTLVELLVVIGILIILMGILLPVISHVRIAVYKTDTQNEINQIAGACNEYYATFNAYPGPFSNDQIEENSNRAPLFLLETYNNANNTTSNPAPASVTASENLVLGLMGGLRPDPMNRANTWAFSPSEVGLGPLSLNSALPNRTPSFFSNGTTYLMWCEKTGLAATSQVVQSSTYQPAYYAFLANSSFTDQAQTKAFDSYIPEFVDRFPTPGPLPILYLRARVGAKGVVSFFGASNYPMPPAAPIDPVTTTTAQYQYDLGDIIQYTSSHIGLPAIDSKGKPMTHNLTGVNLIWYSSPPSPQPPRYYTVKEYPTFDTLTWHANAGPYFANNSVTPTNVSTDSFVNNTGRPRAIDQFILISAGPDGVYGTADDITSFGDVSQ